MVKSRGWRRGSGGSATASNVAIGRKPSGLFRYRMACDITLEGGGCPAGVMTVETDDRMVCVIHP